MKQADLVKNIKDDFITELLPFMRMPPGSLSQLEQAKNTIKTVKTFMYTSTMYTCATIVERNVIEYAMTNYYQQNPSKVDKFGQKAMIKFTATAGASFLTEFVLKRNRNPFKLIVRPALEGALTVGVLVWQQPAEAEKSLKKNFPQAHTFLVQKCYLNEIKAIVEKVRNFIVSPPTHEEVMKEGLRAMSALGHEKVQEFMKGFTGEAGMQTLVQAMAGQMTGAPLVEIVKQFTNDPTEIEALVEHLKDVDPAKAPEIINELLNN